MFGVGQEYFVAFAWALGMGEVWSGLAATLPVVFGATLQLAAPFLIRRVGSLRRYMVLAATLQACTFVPLMIGAWAGAMPLWALYATVAAYSVINLGQAPAWGTWITTLMPRRIRPRYFAARSRVLQGGVLAGLITGGLLLDKGSAASQSAVAFVPLFAVAFVARLTAARLLALHAEPVAMPANFRHVGPGEILRRARHGADMGLLGFLLATTFAWQMALPFFTTFVLDHRGMSYLEFTTLTGAAVVGKMVVAPTIGRVAHRYGPKRVVWIGAVGLVPLAPMWLMADSFALLLIVQFVWGGIISCYDVGALLMQYDSIPEHERASLLATFTAANAWAAFGGSLLGAALLSGAGASLLGLGELGWSGYALAFGAAAVLRLAALPLLARVRPAAPEGEGVLVATVVRVEPGAGPTVAPATDMDGR